MTWVVDAGGGFIGSASLHSFGDDGTTAAYAVGLLAPDVLGDGLGDEVTRLVLAHAFDDLGLRELTVRVLEFNSRAIGCYARCGFSPLRREPDAVTLDGILLRGRDHAPGGGGLSPARRHVGLGASAARALLIKADEGVVMSESERPSGEPVKTGAESSESRSAWVGGGSLGQPQALGFGHVRRQRGVAEQASSVGVGAGVGRRLRRRHRHPHRDPALTGVADREFGASPERLSFRPRWYTPEASQVAADGPRRAALRRP